MLDIADMPKTYNMELTKTKEKPVNIEIIKQKCNAS